jgi:acetoacetate decarboxylase
MISRSNCVRVYVFDAHTPAAAYHLQEREKGFHRYRTERAVLESTKVLPPHPLSYISHTIYPYEFIRSSSETPLQACEKNGYNKHCIK